MSERNSGTGGRDERERRCVEERQEEGACVCVKGREGESNIPNCQAEGCRLLV